MSLPFRSAMRGAVVYKVFPLLHDLHPGGPNHPLTNQVSIIPEHVMQRSVASVHCKLTSKS